MRTLVVHHGALGDFVLACPSIAGLAAEGAVVLAGIRERVGLAVAAGLAADAVDLDSIGFSSVFSTPNQRLRAFLKDFDRVIVWLDDTEGRITRAIEGCGVGLVRCFPGLPGPGFARAAWRYYTESLGLPEGMPPALRIAPVKEAVDVVLHAGSGGRKKCWGLGHFLYLAVMLRKAGRRVQFCRGPAEQGWQFPEDCEVLPEMKLGALAGTLAAAKLYIGNDSGVTHLAAAVGCPTVAVFGETDPRIWAPSGAHVRVAGRLAHWPSEEQVLAAAQALLAMAI